MSNLKWADMYELAKKYYKEYKNLEIKQKFRTNDGITYDPDGEIRLGEWLAYQRLNCDPESEKGKLLLRIGMRFEKTKGIFSWEEMYKFAEKYSKKYGNLEIKLKFTTDDGIIYKKNGKIHLGSWIAYQRYNCDPESEKGKLLSKIGMRFEKIRCTKSWEEVYELAKKYFEENGNLEVKQKFVTNDGVTYDPNGEVHLGTWIARQRQVCDPESEKGKMLLKIGMRFERIISTKSWEEIYKYAKKYFEKYGNLDVKFYFRTNDGITYDPDGEVHLGNWIAAQRRFCDPESKRGKLLSNIGMRFKKSRNTLSWEEMYEYAKKYFEEYGDLKIKSEFITNDGVTYDPDGEIHLGRWIVNQKSDCDPESERGKLLLKIGMNFEKMKKVFTDWSDMYALARDYYVEHKNLLISYDYKTADGLHLGSWIGRQRNEYRLNNLPSEKIYLLECIGMVWDVRNNKFNVLVLCDKYDIDVDINYEVLKNISCIEFEVKLKFLDENYVSPVDYNGKLHEIFTMSNINMQVKYGVSLEDLVNRYRNEKIK